MSVNQVLDRPERSSLRIRDDTIEALRVDMSKAFHGHHISIFCRLAEPVQGLFMIQLFTVAAHVARGPLVLTAGIPRPRQLLKINRC